MKIEELQLQGISQILVSENILDKEKALNCQNKALEKGESLLSYLATNGIVPAQTLALAMATGFGIPLFDLNSIEPDSMPVSLIPEKLIRKHNLLPLFHRGNYLYVAIDDPSKQAALKEIQFHTALTCVAIITETAKLDNLINNLLNEKENTNFTQYIDDSYDLESLEISSAEESKESELLTNSTDDAPIVKFVNKIIVDAIKKGVSDIHFEPFEQEYRIRYRQDGLLHAVASPPSSLAPRITARIKIMSNIDISERRVPQDGGFKMKFSKTRSVDFRVSSCPTIGGEKIVIRLLDADITKLGVEKLGFNKTQKSAFLSAIAKPQGMILVTGPTGSGKTVSMYTAINILNKLETNISTAEDPVEIKLFGINQVNVNIKAGLTFSSALRAFLRQDPDIIMVGEVRDLETAEIAVKAAQTGHLVLSTLHTNSAAETVVRLLNMGIPTFNLASSISLIMAQRLVRKLCDACKIQRDDFTPQSLVELGFSEQIAQNVILYKAQGCEHCQNGYTGRIGLFEVMPMTKSLGQAIMSGANSMDIKNKAQAEGMITIYESGLEKVQMGLTSIEEVNRVTVD